MFLFLNLRYLVKRNNLRTLCGVVVYHLALVTRKRNQAKRAKTTTTIHNDPKWSTTIKTNRQKIHNNQAKTSSALLRTSGKTDFDISLFIALTMDDLYGLFYKITTSKQKENRRNLGLFFHDCLLTPMSVECFFLSAWLNIESAKKKRVSER